MYIYIYMYIYTYMYIYNSGSTKCKRKLIARCKIYLFKLNIKDTIATSLKFLCCLCC